VALIEPKSKAKQGTGEGGRQQPSIRYLVEEKNGKMIRGRYNFGMGGMRIKSPSWPREREEELTEATTCGGQGRRGQTRAEEIWAKPHLDEKTTSISESLKRAWGF